MGLCSNMQSLGKNEDFSTVESCQGIRELIYKSNILSDLMPESSTRCNKGKHKSLPSKNKVRVMNYTSATAMILLITHVLSIFYKHSQAKRESTLTLHVQLFWESCLVLLALVSLALQGYHTAGQSFLLCTDLV